MNIIRKRIGKEIRKIRKSLELTQAEFVDLFNKRLPRDITMRLADISRYELSSVRIPAEKLEKIRSLGN